MCSPCRRSAKRAALVLLAAAAAQASTLRVCADPNNLPFSDRQEQGFENKLASMIAAGMNAQLEYTWWSQRKGFAKKSLDQDACDVILGLPSGMPGVLTTQPYYRSTYVFLSRKDRRLNISSLADPRLADLRIGIHVVGDDYAPPAAALAHRGITQNVIGFSLFGEYGELSPARKLIDAVASGAVDIAIVWGPFAGYFAQRETMPLEITPVQPPAFLGVPFAYDISAAVKSGNDELKDKLDNILQSHAAAIKDTLDEYGVPQVR